MRQQYHRRLVDGEAHIWDVHRLVELSRDLPVLLVEVDAIAEVDERWWFQDEDDPPTPRGIASHVQLVEEANLEYPIILCADSRLMDGMHRVVRALSRGETCIKAVRFKETPAPDYFDVDLSELPYDD